MSQLDWDLLISGDECFSINHSLIAGKFVELAPKYSDHISKNPSTGMNLAHFKYDENTLPLALHACEQVESKLRDNIKIEDLSTYLEQLVENLTYFRQDFINVLKIEIGKTNTEAISEFEASLRYCTWTAKNVSSILTSIMLSRKTHGSTNYDLKLLPIGTVLSYTPFSTPIAHTIQTLVGSILARCPLILFSSTQACLTTYLFSKCIEKLGMPDGAANVVFTPFEGLLKCLPDKRVKAVIYTGSAEHCAKLKANSKGYVSRQLILQSGGKNTALVHSSAEIEQSSNDIVFASTRFAGQLCTSTNRVFVFRSKLNEFIEAVHSKYSDLEIIRTDTDTRTSGPFTMGPLYSEKSVERHLRFQTMAGREAAESIMRGKLAKPDEDSTGYFVSPGIHLMDQLDPTKMYQKTVLMAPDIAVYVYDVLNQAIDQINQAESAHVVSFYGDPQILEDRRLRILAPNLTVNQPTTTETSISLPLAGRGPYGHHRFLGAMLAFYLSYPQGVMHQSAENLNHET